MSKILIVEDDKYLLNAYRVKLTKAGYEVETAMDGLETLQVLQRLTPDLIVLDLVLPKKDGFSTLQDIQANEKWKTIPVIVVSNLGQKEDIDRALKLGARDFIIKTELNLNALIDKLQSFIKT